MSVYKRPGQEFYSFDFRWRGNRYSGSTGEATKRAAERFEQVERDRIKADTVDTAKPMTLTAATGLYFEQKGQFLANWKDELRAHAWLEKQIGGSTLLSAISDSTVAQAVAKRRGQKVRGKLVSPATVNRTITQPLRALLRRAERTWKQKVQAITWGDHFLEEAQERIREASADEEGIMLAKARADYAPAVRFALLTGCRREEIVGLCWRNVDFPNREFSVTGKRDKSRTIPMTEPVYALLKMEFPHHGEKVFTYAVKRTRDGRKRGQRLPITMEGFKTEWRRLRARAKLVDFKFHDTRHTAATRLVRKSGNLKLAQVMLGHSDLATTSRYAHVTKSDLRAAMEATHATGNATTVTEERAKLLKEQGNAG